MLLYQTIFTHPYFLRVLRTTKTYNITKERYNLMKLIIIKPHETDEANQIFYQVDVIIILLYIYYNIIYYTV